MGPQADGKRKVVVCRLWGSRFLQRGQPATEETQRPHMCSTCCMSGKGPPARCCNDSCKSNEGGKGARGAMVGGCTSQRSRMEIVEKMEPRELVNCAALPFEEHAAARWEAARWEGPLCRCVCLSRTVLLLVAPIRPDPTLWSWSAAWVIVSEQFLNVHPSGVHPTKERHQRERFDAMGPKRDLRDRKNAEEGGGPTVGGSG
jgi:hypothetical protein